MPSILFIEAKTADFTLNCTRYTTPAESLFILSARSAAALFIGLKGGTQTECFTVSEDEIKVIQFDFSWGGKRSWELVESQSRRIFAILTLSKLLATCLPAASGCFQRAGGFSRDVTVSHCWLLKAAGTTSLCATCCMMTSALQRTISSLLRDFCCFGTLVTFPNVLCPSVNKLSHMLYL